ncbi:MAG: FAD-dependent oxidoreductase [Holophagales bacterium]|nr:FAD-dependent oxidoreductase [Holophagales bacterium]
MPISSPCALPARLAERARVVGAGTRLTLDDLSRHGSLVLYWMRTAVRAHENPALDAALELGQRLGLPVFVYHGIDERYPYASDRHHLFLLEGARDVAAELETRRIGYALHVARPGHRPPALRQLAGRAAVVVTEDMPVAPLQAWAEGLAGAVRAPIVALDTACVVPMGLVPPDATNRAFRFRDATRSLRRERLAEPWPEIEPSADPYVPDLSFEPVGLRDADLTALVGECEIDHAVGPVPHTRGGSKAGYARWAAFREKGLGRYARDRNDPLRDGVSRMSPYLHYGMVSPFRLAREAAADRSRGANKYLDELLIWRELAYAYCYRQPKHDTFEAIPAWARDTLAAHSRDPRPALFSWETLARGRTGDPLWDAAQLSLLRQGELHNNVRMTWGKAFLGWTSDAERALELAIDLNHRYALDGRDPASYGGILWCFGAFDRPFEPGRAILGTVRSRSTGRHAQRLGVDRYRARVEACPFGQAPAVLVVGSGLAGLACARTLHDAGLRVKVLDKGSGPGGRLASRRQDGLAFDYGAQYFTARDPRFRRLVDAWCHDDVAAPWGGRVAILESGQLVGERPGERFVGTPDLRSIACHLAEDLDVRQSARVVSLERRGKRWRVDLADGESFSVGFVALTAPAPQALDLLPREHAFAEPLARVELAPCHALMAAFGEPLPLPTPGFSAAFVRDSALAWIARDSSKPRREAGERWVLHTTPEWSRAHLEDEPEEAGRELLSALERALGAPLPRAAWCRVHRWRYARVLRSLGRDRLFDPETGLGYAGDACLGSRVEDAYLSGIALAGTLLRHLHQNPKEIPSLEGEPLRLPFE